ncbi:hypothetical protein PAI11_43330 [Patulibacter medicamentivorans]|uniref:Thioredoxin domain-containing protein n=1 Tax=Patulibacter medicamentivorans TaxID=1097667 RepID=H0EBV0_9ACTN|nr:hypothetical protein [Patulibacter medicamentivorans]EHN08852.1 hypothetical protein PAI11_43330 [Patulibacter medicamentivorans]
MSAVWIVATVLAWAVVALLVAVVVTLLRQVGELRADVARLLGSGPLGPAEEPAPLDAALYDRVEPFSAGVLHDGDVRHAPAVAGSIAIGGEDDRPALLVFHAPGCASCEGIEESLQEVVAERASDDDPVPADGVRVLSVLALGEPYAIAHLQEQRLHGVPTIAFDDLPEQLQPESTPSLVGVARGSVVALGRPTDPDHLREAARACEDGVFAGAPDSVRIADWGETIPFWELDGDGPDGQPPADPPSLDVRITAGAEPGASALASPRAAPGGGASTIEEH